MLLIFSEIIPKAFGWEFANQLIIKTSQILNLFKYIFYPINILLTSISNFLLKKFQVAGEKSVENILTQKDVRTFIYESEKHGIIESKEKEIISNI